MTVGRLVDAEVPETVRDAAAATHPDELGFAFRRHSRSDHYFRQCAIQMSCAELALAAGYLARHGVRLDGSRLVSRSDAKRVNAVMLTCGTYDAAGEFAYRVAVVTTAGPGSRNPVRYPADSVHFGPNPQAWGRSSCWR